MKEVPPFRILFGRLTDRWNARETSINAFNAFEEFFEAYRDQGLNYDTYLSTVISGGGYYRSGNISLSESLQRNVATATRLTDRLYADGALDPANAIEAASLGSIQNWRQDEYMNFWYAVMSGTIPTFDYCDTSNSALMQLQESGRLRGIDWDFYRDRTIPHTQRLGAYILHAQTFIEGLYRANETPANYAVHGKIRRLVQLIDTDYSLGAQAEKYVAQRMGAQILRPMFAQLHPSLPDDYEDTELRESIEKLNALGAPVLRSNTDGQFILLPDMTPIALRST